MFTSSTYLFFVKGLVSHNNLFWALAHFSDEELNAFIAVPLVIGKFENYVQKRVLSIDKMAEAFTFAEGDGLEKEIILSQPHFQVLAAVADDLAMIESDALRQKKRSRIPYPEGLHKT